MAAILSGEGRVTRGGRADFSPLATHHSPLHRKAGRYKLAAPVPKTGSDLRSREHYPGLPPAFARGYHAGEVRLRRSAKREDGQSVPHRASARRAHFNHQPEETNMTIAQYLPRWLQNRLQKPVLSKPTTVNKKGRQVLPTLPNTKASIPFEDGQRPPGYQLRGLT